MLVAGIICFINGKCLNFSHFIAKELIGLKLSKEKLFEYMQSFLYAVVTFLFLYVFLWPISVEGVSMEGAVENGDRVFISRALCMAGFYGRGDIVMIKVSYDPNKEFIVKRIAAIPGDSVKINNGSLFINGEEIKGCYVGGSGEFVLENGAYFVLGDNYEHSYDSRNFGALNKKDIVGKVIFRWYPLKNIKAY